MGRNREALEQAAAQDGERQGRGHRSVSERQPNSGPASANTRSPAASTGGLPSAMRTNGRWRTKPRSPSERARAGQRSGTSRKTRPAQAASAAPRSAIAARLVGSDDRPELGRAPPGAKEGEAAPVGREVQRAARTGEEVVEQEGAADPGRGLVEREHRAALALVRTGGPAPGGRCALFAAAPGLRRPGVGGRPCAFPAREGEPGHEAAAPIDRRARRGRVEHGDAAGSAQRIDALAEQRARQAAVTERARRPGPSRPSRPRRRRARPPPSRPAGRRRSRQPIASPRSMKSVQSSAVWFQPAASESASPAAPSPRSSRSIASTSELAIADLELGRLVEARSARADPVGDPVEHAAERNQRVAEQARRLGRVGEERGLGLAPGDLRRSRPGAPRARRRASGSRSARGRCS